MLLAVAVAAVGVAAAFAAAVDDEAPMVMDDTPREMDERTPECHDAMVPWSIGPAGRDRLA